MYVISRCLLGENCKYNGGNNRNEAVIEFCRTHRCIAICPETAGNLPSPRPPAERVGSRILDREGRDVTEAFETGADLCLKACLAAAEREGEALEGAILKANSPSCGFGQIYDGTFSGTLTEGNGIFAEQIHRCGIDVITEKETIKW